MADVDFELLISVTTGLGRHVPTPGGPRVYAKDADCLNCLKDLTRFLRRDDPDTRDVFFELCKKQIPTAHLVPILTTYPDDTQLVFNALKVLTFLTMPVDMATDQPSTQVRGIFALRCLSALLSNMTDRLPKPCGVRPLNAQASFYQASSLSAAFGAHNLLVIHFSSPPRDALRSCNPAHVADASCFWHQDVLLM